jgi:hypothetical protein
MCTVFSKRNIALTLLLLMLSGQCAFAKKMYRWADENGKVFYSDLIPPEQSKHRRESLNKNVRVVEIVEKEKTKAQRELENRLNALRKQQQRIINKQKALDKVLLSTFRTLDDMEVALKAKLSSLDGQRKSMQGNLSRLKKQLQQQQKKAAQFERDGRKVPAILIEDISGSKHQIDLAIVDIAKQFEKKAAATEKFEVDMERFSFLTQANMGRKDLSRQTADIQAENELGLFICESELQCNKAWKNAKKFVRLYSTAAFDIETDKLVLSQAPYKDTDLSLSVSKMNVENNKQQLFLDIRCRLSSVGIELCHGEKVKKIRNSFSDYIKAALAAESKE